MKKKKIGLSGLCYAFIALTICTAFVVTKHREPHPWKTGVALYSFNKFSFAQSLKKADSAGARYIEGFFFHKMGKEFGDKMMFQLSDEEVGKMVGMIEQKKLSMKSMYVGGAKTVDDWKKFFEIAAKCKMDYLVCEPLKSEWDLIDSLAGIYQIRIAIHEHAKRESPYWHPDSVLAAIKGHRNIGACADLGHWVRSGLDPVECLKKLRGHILGVHLKDVDKDHNDVLVGTGVIDFGAVVAELKAQRFSGTVNVECEHDWENNVQEVRKSLSYFDSIN